MANIKDNEMYNLISNIIYNALDYAYCDNCRFDSEQRANDEDERYFSCENCHRKYSSWEVSRAVANMIAKEIIATIDSYNKQKDEVK